MTPSEAAASYRTTFALKPMKRSADNDDELRQMTATDGMNEFPSAPASSDVFPYRSSAPTTRSNAPDARHLWVIGEQDFPIALEACSWGASLQSGKIKHSNLTGGKPAHSGGEVWFLGADKIAVNASSGRYGANNEQEFDQIVEALRRAGYHVASMGFDLDNSAIPNAIFVGDPVWQAPIT